MEIRDALKAALAKYVAEGRQRSEAYGKTRGGRAAEDVTWAAANLPHEAHVTFDCTAHNEGQFCCLDPRHEHFEGLVSFLANELATR